jgi:antitoxin ParD1/3/4
MRYGNLLKSHRLASSPQLSCVDESLFAIGNLCQWRYNEPQNASLLRRFAGMPTRNVNLTDKLDRFVAKTVKSGRYENASEVVRAGLRSLERQEREFEAKLQALRAAVAEGDSSGVARGNVFVRVRKALKLPASR